MHKIKAILIAVFTTLLAGFIAFWVACAMLAPVKFDLKYGWDTMMDKAGNSLLIIVLALAALVCGLVLAHASRHEHGVNPAAIIACLLGLAASVVWLSVLINELSDEDTKGVWPTIILVGLLVAIGVGTANAVVPSTAKVNK